MLDRVRQRFREGLPQLGIFGDQPDQFLTGPSRFSMVCGARQSRPC